MAPRLTRNEIGPVEAADAAACHAHAGMVTAIMGGELKTLGTGSPEFSSAATGWSGFLFERHSVPGDLEEVGWLWHSTHVGMCTSGSSVIRVCGGAGKIHGAVHPGSVFIFPRGCDHTNIRISGGVHRFVVAELDSAGLERLLPDSARPSDESLAAQLNIDDPQIVRNHGQHAGRSCGGLSVGVTVRRISFVGTGRLCCSSLFSQNAQAREGGARVFSYPTSTVIDYIHAHLKDDLSLIELAAAINLSPRHFSRLFRKTFGTTAYRYVMDERINRVKTLLATKRLSILEIGEALGFADQSHLTNAFRKATGVTPRRYQRAC